MLVALRGPRELLHSVQSVRTAVNGFADRYLATLPIAIGISDRVSNKIKQKNFKIKSQVFQGGGLLVALRGPRELLHSVQSVRTAVNGFADRYLATRLTDRVSNKIKRKNFKIKSQIFQGGGLLVARVFQT